MPSKNPEQLHVRLSSESMEVLKYATHGNSRFSTYGDVINEALSVWKLSLDGSFDEAIEDIERNAQLKKEKVLSLKAKIEDGMVIVPPLTPVLVEKVKTEEVAYARFTKEELLARCNETEPAGVLDWARAWKNELLAVGWESSDFVNAKISQLRTVPKTAKVAPSVQDPVALTPAQNRIEALVLRLYRIATGAPGMDHFDFDFKEIRRLGINNGQIGQFKDTVLKKFSAKVLPDITAKKMKKESAEATVAIFEDKWMREFETTNKEKELLRGC
jgi:hypothetical protein